MYWCFYAGANYENVEVRLIFYIYLACLSLHSLDESGRLEMMLALLSLPSLHEAAEWVALPAHAQVPRNLPGAESLPTSEEGKLVVEGFRTRPGLAMSQVGPVGMAMSQVQALFSLCSCVSKIVLNHSKALPLLFNSPICHCLTVV